jgi:hypothetical protein
LRRLIFPPSLLGTTFHHHDQNLNRYVLASADTKLLNSHHCPTE